MSTDDRKPFSKAMYQFIFPPPVYHSSSCSTSLSTFSVLGLSNFSHSGFNDVFLIKPFCIHLLAVGCPLLRTACSSHLSNFNRLSILFGKELLLCWVWALWLIVLKVFSPTLWIVFSLTGAFRWIETQTFTIINLDHMVRAFSAFFN